MPLHVYKNADELNVAFADWLVELIEQTLQKQNRFTIALSGGSTPKNYMSS